MNKLKRYDIIVLITVIVVVAGILIWRIPIMMRAPLDAARAYCGGENVSDVQYSASTKTTKVISTLLGGGATYHPAHGEAFQCPVVGPDSMSDACKAALDVTDWVSVCSSDGTPTPSGVTTTAGADPLNTTYTIDGEAFTLVNGIATTEVAPGSATKDTVSLFGVPVYGDLDDDGDEDAVVMLRRMGGGSGTFYYAATAIKTGDGFKGTNAILLGDRIAPENVTIQSGVVSVNYADRAPSEPMTTQPSIGKTLYATISNGIFTPVKDMAKGYGVLYGNLSLSSDGGATFRQCGSGQPSYAISADSPFLSDIAMMFGGESGSVYAVVVGQVLKGTTMRIDRIVRLSSIAKCQSDLIILDAPRPNGVVTSPLQITGRARGNWFFEASFPVILTDWDGRIIAQGTAQAKGDWMTDAFVPFEATLTFTAPAGGAGIPDTGSLILKKDNPSGLPANDDALEVTVRFR